MEAAEVGALLEVIYDGPKSRGGDDQVRMKTGLRGLVPKMSLAAMALNHVADHRSDKHPEGFPARTTGVQVLVALGGESRYRVVWFGYRQEAVKCLAAFMLKMIEPEVPALAVEKLEGGEDA